MSWEHDAAKLEEFYKWLSDPKLAAIAEAKRRAALIVDAALLADGNAEWARNAHGDHKVKEFLDEAFGYVDLDWNDYVTIDERYFRPAEVDLLIGDYAKAKTALGWEPTVRFKELVRMMVDGDRERESLKEHYL